MIKSFIDPNKILGDETKAVSPEAFSNFMTGRNAEMKSSALSSAANNISNFSRSSVGVKADSNLAPIISNISTSITNNIDNSVSNTLNSFRTEFNTIVGGLQKKVESNLTAAIQSFSKDYQEKISSKEDSSSSKILKDFISVYKNAMDFVASLGDSRNNKRIESSLKSLRSMFDESFNAAVIIRQTISKIVKQLSNLPTASPKSGGLDLNIEVPGGPLKQQGNSSIGKALKGRGGAMLAAGAVGATAVGVGALGMQAAQTRQEEKLAETAKKDKGKNAFDDFIDGMNNIIKSFSDSISRLLGGGKDEGKAGASASSSSGSSPSPSPGTSVLQETTPPGGTIEGNVGEIISTDASASYYDPSLGGINASGAKTPEGLPATSTGEGFIGSKFTAAAFPELLQRLPQNMTTATRMRGGRTLARGQAFNVLVTDKTGKSAVLRINDVGPGVPGHPSHQMLDLSPAASNYFGTNKSSGLKIIMAPASSTPGPVSPEQVQQILSMSSEVRPQNTQTQQTRPTTAQPQTQSRVQPTPQSNQQAQQIQNVTRSPSDQKPSVAVINAPPEIAAIPTGETQSGGGGNMMQLPPASSSGQDVSMYGQTGNPNNPYWFAPFDFRILNMA